MSTHPPFGASMPSPAEMDAALYELAVARSSAAWMPSNTSSTRRPRSNRITKPGSAGNSPQRMPRRRTTASHQSAKSRSDLFPQTAYTTQTVPNVSGPQSLSTVMSTRPLSWHPSSMMSGSTASFSEYPMSNHRLSIGPYEPIDFNGMSASMAHATGGSPYDGWYHFNGSTSTFPYRNSIAASPFETPEDESPTMYPINFYGQPSYIGASGAPSMISQTTLISPPQYAMEAFPSMPPTSFYSTTAFTAPTTPDALPIQQHSDPLVERHDVPQQSSSGKVTSEAKRDEPELIGMGLYDHPTQTSFLFDGPNSPTLHGSPSMGKGLKLEETWEPPSESNSELDSSDDADGEDDDEDDDDAMSDGMDTAFESTESLPSATLNLPFQQPEPLAPSKLLSPLAPPEPWSPPQDDLAGRSFYLDDGSPVSLDSDAAQLWLMAMMTHAGAHTALAT